MIFFYNNADFQNLEFIKGLNAANVFILAVLMVGVNAIAEVIVCGILGTAIAKPLEKYVIRNNAWKFKILIDLYETTWYNNKAVII